MRFERVTRKMIVHATGYWSTVLGILATVHLYEIQSCGVRNQSENRLSREPKT